MPSRTKLRRNRSLCSTIGSYLRSDRSPISRVCSRPRSVESPRALKRKPRRYPHTPPIPRVLSIAYVPSIAETDRSSAVYRTLSKSRGLESKRSDTPPTSKPNEQSEARVPSEPQPTQPPRTEKPEPSIEMHSFYQSVPVQPLAPAAVLSFNPVTAVDIV